MADTALIAGFLTDLQQHWPFPTALTDCTLVSAGFNQPALSDKLFAHYAVPAPKAVLKRQAEFLAARICAREALRLQTGEARLPSQQSHSRIPLWPQHTCGSMTHSQQLCAAIVGQTDTWQSLGLDLEKPIPLARAQRLAKSILTAHEYAAYNCLAPEQQAQRLTLVFSLKESLFKALNPLTGIYFGFHDAHILEFEGVETGHARLCLNKDLSAAWQAGDQLEGQFTQLHGSTLTVVGIANTSKEKRHT